MRIAALVSLQLVGCGRIAFDHLASGDASADVDADTLGTGPRGPADRIFAAPGPFDDVSLTSDELALFVNYDDRLMTATRTSTSDPWGDPVMIPALAAVRATQPFVSGDGLTLIFIEFIGGGTRVSTAVWGTPVQALDLDTPNLASDVAIRLDGLEAVVTIGPPYELTLVRRSSLTTPWGAREPLIAINTPSTEGEGSFAERGLALYFNSTRGGVTSEDLYRSERPALDVPFGAPVPLDELNSSGEESDPWFPTTGTGSTSPATEAASGRSAWPRASVGYGRSSFGMPTGSVRVRASRDRPPVAAGDT